VRPNRFIIFFLAVIAVSLLGGLAAGLAATLVSALAAIYLFFPPEFSFRLHGAQDWIPIGFFVLIASLISILADRLQKRRREVALLQSSVRGERQFQVFFEFSPNALILVESGGRITLVNPKAEALFGYSSEELVGQPIELLVPEPLRGVHVRHRASFSMEPFASRPMGEGRILFARRKDGSLFQTEIALTSVDTAKGRLVMATVLDVTERKRVEEALKNSEERFRAQAEELAQAVRARDDFISVASHELKNPITSLRMQLELRRRELLKKPEAFDVPAHQKMIDSDLRQLERLNRMIDDMLDVTRIRVGKLSIQKEDVEICGLTQEVVDRYAPLCQERGCSLKLQLCDPITGSWDRSRMEQVLSNLITNAIKYGKGSPIEVTVCPKGSASVELRVRDYGPGIPKEDHERIFERFERAVKPGGAIAGLGLGLYIVRKIVELQGGTIHVESQLGEGASFVVRLPLRGE
jgi:PAS domain S-box-containing protein